MRLEKDLKNALDWFDNNSLAPNPDKFQVMFLGTKSKTYLCLEINDRKTVSSPEVTLLGITIDWKLQFNRHVENICKKARKKTGALMRLKNKLDTSQKLFLYNSFIKSQFGYCPIVWLCHGKVVENKINSIQNTPCGNTVPVAINLSNATINSFILISGGLVHFSNRS